MSELKRIGLREVRTLSSGEIIWDKAVTGFAARRQRSDAVTYLVKYRTRQGRQRWHKLGRHGAPWTPETARDEATRILGSVASGADPAAERRSLGTATNVAELCDAYFADAETGRVLTRGGDPKKASTLAIDKGRIERHIKPLIGGLAVAAVTRNDIDRFLHDVAAGKTANRSKSAKKRGLARVTGGRTAATRATGLLGAIFSYAVRHSMRIDNPVHGVARFVDRKRQRRLSDEEYVSLGQGLRQAEAAAMWPPAVGATRFLAITGWRSGEAVALTRAELDLVRRTAQLRDTKSGASLRPLSHAACDVLKGLPQIADDRVFPATRGATDTLLSIKKFWWRIAKLAGLPSDVTLHTLRHSFASVAGDLGYSEPTIAALLGHKGRSVTSGYLHRADAVLLAAADAVADRISELMGEGGVIGEVVPLRA